MFILLDTGRYGIGWCKLADKAAKGALHSVGNPYWICTFTRNGK